MKKFILSFLIITSLSAGKVYINEEDIDIGGNTIYIHEGGNIWREAFSIESDSYGVYFVENEIPGKKMQQVKKWKCPYCHMMWPIGVKCQNADCPSKY